MVSFALITEGVADQAVIENILEGCFDDLDVNTLQPQRDASDKQDGHGGWELAIEYLRGPKLVQALQYNDYVIVQLDTDVAEDPKYGVPKFGDGVERSPTEMRSAVIEKLNHIIQTAQDPFGEAVSARTIFAIAVHSLECWLLPLHQSKQPKQEKTKNCFKDLTRVLQRNINKDYKTFEKLSEGFRNRKLLDKAANSNSSLGSLVSDLDSCSS